jgi:hypothetical protein
MTQPTERDKEKAREIVSYEIGHATGVVMFGKDRLREKIAAAIAAEREDALATLEVQTGLAQEWKARAEELSQLQANYKKEVSDYKARAEKSRAEKAERNVLELKDDYVRLHKRFIDSEQQLDEALASVAEMREALEVIRVYNETVPAKFAIPASYMRPVYDALNGEKK